MRYVLLVVAAMAAACALSGAANAGPLKQLFGCSENLGSTCVIGLSRGGQREIFQEAADEALVFHIRVVFSGTCSSACTLFADVVRKQACADRVAAFGFHKFTHWPSGTVSQDGEVKPGTTALSYYTPDYSPDLQALLKGYGDLPIGEPILYIHAEKAAQVWPVCPEASGRPTSG